MPNLDLKTTNKAIKDYYTGLAEFDKHGVKHEMAVRSAFQRLLELCSRKAGWTFIGEYKYPRKGRKPASIDGGMVDAFTIPQAFWEAKDSDDDLVKEVQNKFSDGYPKDNIVFQEPRRAILWQGGREICDLDITKADALVYVVQELFTYRDQTQLDWEQAVADFKPLIPDAARKVVELIEVERKESQGFIKAFNTFAEVCRTSVNPNLSDSAVEEMLVQHLLTERIFRKVFHNSDFTDRNIIAHEIERVIHSLTSRKFSKEEFLKPLDRFYVALERRAETLYDYSQQQTFLNTVYEKFFQGFAVKQADTHGIVYTPQPIVDFMVRSVEEILKKEFGKSLSDKGVHIIDPFVGTGNFITRLMREIKKTSLPQKYAHELHCNEVMLLPYYVASMNIEHEYYDRTGEYKPFEGICLVDTFELAEQRDESGIQPTLAPVFNQENTERIERLRKTRLFVVIGNPPYNSKQVNENDNNKNRKYKSVDERVSHTYGHDSSASNKNKLADPYVKAIRWASDKVLDNGEGIVAFVSNNSFLDNVAFDGMRKHIQTDFDVVYILDLGGNVRRNPKISGTSHNVFGIQVGVSINLLLRLGKRNDKCRIFYHRVDDFWRKEEKLSFLDTAKHVLGFEWQRIQPFNDHVWLSQGLKRDFATMLPMGTGDKSSTGETLFGLFSLGVNTNRDAWAYNFSQTSLATNIAATIETYNQQLRAWSAIAEKPRLDDFVSTDDRGISWSEGLKKALQAGRTMIFDEKRIRLSLYRPFVVSFLYMDKWITERRYQTHRLFPMVGAECENRAICVGSYDRKNFSVLMVRLLPNLNLFGDPQQAFPFYSYDEDGTNCRENITAWAAEQFSEALGTQVDKWQIFHYVYGLLHSPEYREKYQANLKRELPRIPLPKSPDDFSAFAAAGERLADLHVNYESQQEYPLEKIENPDKPLNWRVEKMKLTKDKTAIIYNDFLTLAGIPPEAFEYKLGNRSALEWIIDRYQIHRDKRSGIVNDPNRPDDREYIVKLIGKVITVSLETVKTVADLPKI
jgi:predicted helicase